MTKKKHLYPAYSGCIRFKLGRLSLVPRPRAPPGEKRSGERSRIPWASYPKRVMTNEIARLVIITWHVPHNCKICSSLFEHPYLFKRAGRRIFLTLLGYMSQKACAIPRNWTWFTRPFLLVRGWGLGTRLGEAVFLPNPMRIT